MMLLLLCWALVIAFLVGLDQLDKWLRRHASKPPFDHESDRW